MPKASTRLRRRAQAEGRADVEGNAGEAVSTHFRSGNVSFSRTQDGGITMEMDYSMYLKTAAPMLILFFIWLFFVKLGVGHVVSLSLVVCAGLFLAAVLAQDNCGVFGKGLDDTLLLRRAGVACGVLW
eukprot:CAMPEP_0205822136 /NCGR_PEP_ID=MMETSP0206-20130828/10998_1 /ASSEMBLY_ACC=CAM_ASM_000279 /TAXON_ID=36767 /ORGANISM="Euplotes focardii, Strain TN1" /LENGTH=127 /DNA_ID=CAMNT_0053118139 /DNA_START=31 /DNA_END=411 /DNA_ORIENTATION=+